MEQGSFRFVAISELHDRAAFTSGHAEIDNYFQGEGLTRDLQQFMAKCYVAETVTHEIGGFFTLSMAVLPLDKLSKSKRKSYGRYGDVPAALLGRMGVNTPFQRQGLGSSMVVEAIEVVRNGTITAPILIVDAKSESLIEFYTQFGFQRLDESPDPPIRMWRMVGAGGEENEVKG
jgi:GNAT superfamily N-acetyltransferase